MLLWILYRSCEHVWCYGCVFCSLIRICVLHLKATYNWISLHLSLVTGWQLCWSHLMASAKWQGEMGCVEKQMTDFWQQAQCLVSFTLHWWGHAILNPRSCLHCHRQKHSAVTLQGENETRNTYKRWCIPFRILFVLWVVYWALNLGHEIWV